MFGIALTALCLNRDHWHHTVTSLLNSSFTKHLKKQVLSHVPQCCTGFSQLHKLLSDDAVGEGGGPAQPLALHLKATSFVIGHAPAIDLQIRLEKLPNFLLGLQLPVRLTWTREERDSEGKWKNPNVFVVQIQNKDFISYFLIKQMYFIHRYNKLWLLATNYQGFNWQRHEWISSSPENDHYFVNV